MTTSYNLGMPRYHFSAGNSSEGPIGFCAEVIAETAEGALEKLRGALPSELPVRPWREEGDGDGIAYVEVYLNPDALTLEDMDEA